jgi:hypothetical protein
VQPWQIGIIGGIVGGLSVAVLGLLLPARKCPECGNPLPRIRKPANARQAKWGGWTCSKCGCEVDRRGKKLVE